MTEANWYDNWMTPALLRLARDTYSSVIQGALVEGGYLDMPRDGPYVVGGMALTGAPMSQLIRQMGMSKQAAGQLVDTLVDREYLERSVAIEDRRRLTLTLTEKGRAAADVVRSAVDRVDAQLAQIVGDECVSHTLATLAALVEFEQVQLSPA